MNQIPDNQMCQLSDNQMCQLPEIQLRAMEPEDLELLYEIENDRSLWHVGVSNVPYSRYVLRDYIAKSVGDIYTDCQVRLIMEDKHRQTVGIIDIVNFDTAHRRAEVGIIVRQEYRQKGYASAALQEAFDYSKRILHLHQLYAIVATDNKPGLKLFQKMGFQHTSDLKEWLFDGEKYHDVTVLQLFFEKKQ